MAISAVIPVREGSTRVKNKNIREFAGSSLLEIKIKQLMRIKEIDKVIVSSDSKQMLQLAERLGAIPHVRPIEYCDEKSKTFNEVVTYIAENAVSDDIMIWAPCVCPLLMDQSIEKGIMKYREVREGKLLADSVVTAKLIKEYLFNENGPINFSIEHHVPSQKLPDWYTIVNGFFIARREDMAKWGFVYGPKPHLLKLDKHESIDIDDETDFIIAEHLFNRQMKGGSEYEK